MAVKSQLGCGPGCQSLQPVEWGTSMEASTLHAGCLEIATRLDTPDWVFIPPSASVALSIFDQHEARGSNQEEFARLLSSVAASCCVSVPVWAQGHYTYLRCERASVDVQWNL